MERGPWAGIASDERKHKPVASVYSNHGVFGATQLTRFIAQIYSFSRIIVCGLPIIIIAHNCKRARAESKFNYDKTLRVRANLTIDQ